ncbi:hypothetical protein [Microbacterium karelineae]|uniref:hypothetical protein n=1 Tax=Microbacterium karelineae TaxID=2654283 RepID=UPI0012E9EF59|nr:hypothetical protein [Microbacterium karelineae]
MVDLTPSQRERTGAIVAKVEEVDWNGDITPYVDDIVSIISQLIDEDPALVEFADVIRDQAAKWSIAAWSENIELSGWGTLSDRLGQISTP